MAAVGPSDPSGVIEAHRDQDALRPLTAQLTPAQHLRGKTGRQPLQPITAHAQVVEHRCPWGGHPVAPEPFTPAALFGIAPAEHAAVAKHHELARKEKAHGATGWGSNRERSSPITR